jgi:LmbE family N-acetylglucosaminyl deacetylase
MLQESEIIPYHHSPPPGERVLVLAPHPDDESLGCGGTIRLLLNAKKNVKVIFLTSGEKADPNHTLAHSTAYSLLREKEAEAALRVLGVSDYDFLRFPDREIHVRYRNVLKRLLKAVEEFMPDALYSPSMIELNPDHRTAAALSMELQRSATCGVDPSPLRVVFYEVALPLRPNILVDITSVYRRKKSAVKRYKSQLKLMDYLRHITALNTIRSLTVNGSRYVEAFWSIDRPLSDEEISGWLSYKQFPR